MKYLCKPMDVSTFQMAENNALYKLENFDMF